MKPKRKKSRWLVLIPLIAVVVIAPTACHHGYHGGGNRGFNPEERHERGIGNRGYAGRRYHDRGEIYDRRRFNRGFGYGGDYGWGFSGHYHHSERHERGGRHPSDGDRYRELSGSSLETRDRERGEERD
ncbi:MAG: hypothetical protein ACI8UO_003674 [Verrucomicrobiales bacterium]|jgi:hypothetical protein